MALPRVDRPCREVLAHCCTEQSPGRSSGTQMERHGLVLLFQKLLRFLFLLFCVVLLNCLLSDAETKVPMDQLQWTFMLRFSPSSHPNPSPLLLQRNSRLCSFCDTAWRPQGAQGCLLDSSCCPGAAAQRTPVPVLPSSQGSPGGCRKLGTVCWTTPVVPAQQLLGQ